MLDTFTHNLLNIGFLGLDLKEIITWIGVPGVLAIIFAESGLLIGFFLPGDSLLFISGLLIGTNVINMPIWLFVVLLAVTAIIGDNVGYEFGKHVGPKIFKKPDSLFFRKENIQKAEDFYEKHGGKTIVLARFMPFIRTFAPIVAGIGKMDHKKFFLFNAAGGILWTFSVTLLGYFLGNVLINELKIKDIDMVIIPIVLLIVILSVLPAIIELLKTKEKRDNLKKSLKNSIKTYKKYRANKKAKNN